jgi:adenylate cyclase
VRTPPRILVVDDNPLNLDILATRLTVNGYAVSTATDGEAALEIASTEHPDLILLDVMMPKLDGTEVCRRLKADPSLPFMPIIMVTARADVKDIVAGLDAGADEYLTKPVDQAALIARVKSMLRIKALHDTVQEQTVRLAAQASELEAWNQTLEQRVADQLAELERVGRLRRFLSPQIADAIVLSGDDAILQSHRRQIAVLFCDLRGFTPFAETAEPEEVLGVLGEYHQSMGELIFQFEGTVGHFAGDGLMVFFNDPLPCPDPAARAVGMAVAMRERMDQLTDQWHKFGHELGFGVGIALGYATLGQIGFQGRFDYGVIGSVVNLASRLCDEAASGQVLVNQRVFADVENLVRAEPVGDLTLKGYVRPVTAYNVVGLKAALPSPAIP